MIPQKGNSSLRISLKFFPAAIFFLLLFSSIIFAQPKETGTVSGTVFDKSSGKPVSDVNVYISHSTFGTTTNAEGAFSIRNIPVGVVNVIVSFVGYEIQTEKIEIKNNFNHELIFYLEKKVYQLPTVVINSEDAEEWQKNYETFFNQFIGTSNNARECSISDPYDLEFETDEEGALIAKTSKPIEIINKALGYKITYFFESFRHLNRSVKYNGFPVFEELKPSSAEEKKRWEKNRIKTYRGSLRHFLYAASRDYDEFLKKGNKLSDEAESKSLLEKEGFSVMSVRTVDVGFKKYKEYAKLQSPGFIFLASDKNEKILSFPDEIQITYLGGKEEENYLRFIGVFRDSDWRRSILNLHSVAVKFNSKGYYFDDFRIEMLGYFAFERMADQLPFDFTPPDSLLILQER